MILPLPCNDILDREDIEIVDVLLNIGEQLGDQGLLVVDSEVDFKLIIFYRSMS
jgi:hypothetical protein